MCGQENSKTKHDGKCEDQMLLCDLNNSPRDKAIESDGHACKTWQQLGSAFGHACGVQLLYSQQVLKIKLRPNKEDLPSKGEIWQR